MSALLLDIGNTNTHVGLGSSLRVSRHSNFPTTNWFDTKAKKALRTFLRKEVPDAVVFCSVVPRATRRVRQFVKRLWDISALELTSETVCDLGVDYPKPKTIGPDRLANALAARHHYGAPVVVVDFGTAVTFDVVNGRGDYTGGIIAPGVAAMTDYLHEKTALLPRITIREPDGVVGKSTEQAMLVGAVHGYRGLIKQLVLELKRELRASRLPVVATGGYGTLIARRLSEITSIAPLLTLEGLRLFWQSTGAQTRPRPSK
jgi:type III pantothenate kinase